MAVFQKVIYCPQASFWLEKFKKEAPHFRCCVEAKVEKGLGYVGSAVKLSCRFEGKEDDLTKFLTFLGIAPVQEVEEESAY